MFSTTSWNLKRHWLWCLLGVGLTACASNAQPAPTPPPEVLAFTTTPSLNPYPALAEASPAPTLAISDSATPTSNSPISTPAPTLTPLDFETLPNGWRLYTNLEAGYSIQVPPEANVQIYAAGHGLEYPQLVVEFISQELGYQAMDIVTYNNPDHLNPEQFILNYYAKEGKPVPADISTYSQSITLGAVTALRTNLPTGRFRVAILATTPDKVYYAKPYGYMGDYPAPQMIEWFDQIMATFTVLSTP